MESNAVMTTQSPYRTALMRYHKLFLFLSSLVFAVSFARAQGAPPMNQCNQITSVGGDKDVTFRLQSFCEAVFSANAGKPYDPQSTAAIVSSIAVSNTWKQLKPSIQSGPKTAYAVLQLRNGALSNATSNLNTALSAVTQNRPDQQTTASQAANAATSLVQKASGPELVALALETGALTQSKSGNTATLSGNLEGALYTLVGMSPICFVQCGLSRSLLGSVNVSATFALAQQSSTTTSATTPATSSSPTAGTAVTVPSSVGKFTGVTAKYTILNKFDPHSKQFRDSWNAAVTSDKQYANLANTLMQQNGDLSVAIRPVEDATFQAEEAALIADVLTDPQSLASDYDSYLTATYDSAKFNTQSLSAFLQAYSQLSADWQNIRRQGIGTLATVQYSYSKPANQPETHTATLVLSYAPKGSTANGLLTANFGASLYGGTIPAGANYGRVQYGQASAEFDRILFSPSSTGPINLNVAGYWQYQPSASVLNITQSNVAPGTTIVAPTQVLVGTAGSLWVAQAQLQYKNSSGLSIPFGVKWSNKTELLTGNKVGAQIGVSYDFSFLSNALNPSK